MSLSFTILLAVSVYIFSSASRRKKIADAIQRFVVFFVERLVMGVLNFPLAAGAAMIRRWKISVVAFWIIGRIIFWLIQVLFQRTDNAARVAAMTAAFFVLGYLMYEIDTDYLLKDLEKTRLKELEQKKNMSKRARALEREIIMDFRETYWRRRYVDPVLKVYRSLRVKWMLLIYNLTQYYPFSNFWRSSRAHFENKALSFAGFEIEKEAHTRGFPCVLVYAEILSGAYVLRFQFSKLQPKKLTDSFLRSIEKKKHLPPRSLFLRLPKKQAGGFPSYDVIVPSEVAEALAKGKGNRESTLEI